MLNKIIQYMSPSYRYCDIKWGPIYALGKLFIHHNSNGGILERNIIARTQVEETHSFEPFKVAYRWAVRLAVCLFSCEPQGHVSKSTIDRATDHRQSPERHFLMNVKWYNSALETCALETWGILFR